MPDGHQKLDHTGLTVQAAQFQLPDGTVLGPGGEEMATIINITIEKIVIKDSKIIGVKDCEPDDDHPGNGPPNKDDEDN